MNTAGNTLSSDICEKIANSEKSAFDELFRNMYPKLVGYALRYMREKDTACDIVQECFVKLWKIRESLDTQSSIQAYLFRMVRNYSLNYIRDHAREQTGIDMVNVADEHDQSEIDENENANKNRMKLIRTWIEQLPERQREAFELSRFEGLDHEEIATVMAVSPRTVNNHIVEALKNIQRSHDMYYQR